MTCVIRKAVEADLLAVASLDFYANQAINVPICAGFVFEAPSAAIELFYQRFRFFFSSPQYHVVVATIDEEIVGEISYREPGETKEFKPDYPAGTHPEYFEIELPKANKAKAEFAVDGYWELESCAVSTAHQHKAIGSSLMEYFTSILDEQKAGCSLRASFPGKALYEKFDWKVMGVYEPDLRAFGYTDYYANWFMRRDPRT